MTQAADLGGVANQLAAFYRARVNANFQAVATQHYGSNEPPLMYPNMIWFSSGDGYIKIRNPTNTAWETVGSIGPPMKWTNVDIPQTAFTTGDFKQTFKTVADVGWVMMNDGTIGDGSSAATTRANPDTQALFALLWANIADSWCTLYAAGTTTQSGRGASAASDWAAHRHILLPKALGRVFATAGSGSGLSSFALGSRGGVESVALGLNHVPSHAHSVSVPDHAHGIGRIQSAMGGGNGNQFVPTVTGFTYSTSSGGGFSGNTGAAGSGEAHSNIQPTTYCNVMVKL